LFDPELVDPNMEINFVKDTGDSLTGVKVYPVSKFHRKGNSLNYTILALKESRVTYATDLTIFPYNCRVFCSPSMEELKFSP